jgi:hypothetical protein
LFRKFDDKDHPEMNFKKLLLSRCEKQFYKKLQQEQMARRERRASMDQLILNKQLDEELEQDYNKSMLFVFDNDDLKKQ